VNEPGEREKGGFPQSHNKGIPHTPPIPQLLHLQRFEFLYICIYIYFVLLLWLLVGSGFMKNYTKLFT